MSVDPTRLLVLGVTRQEQPATGYAIMRELSGWGVADWASVNPGSIYGAVRALVKDGLVVEDPDPAATHGNIRVRKGSTKYRLTDHGESAFTDMLRRALSEVSTYRATTFMAALCFLVDLPRDVAATAIEQRNAHLESALRQLGLEEEQKFVKSPASPPHAVEFVRLAAGRLHGELAFTRSLLERIEAGSYDFSGEAASRPRVRSGLGIR